MKKNRTLIFSIAAAFLIVFVSTARAGETDGVTDTEIVIGGLAPITGPASNLGQQIDVAGKIGSRQVNEAGGIHGRKIKYIVGDDVCGSSQGLAAAKKLIYNEKVFALHGLACSHVGMAIRPILEKEGVPIIITIAQGDKILIPQSKVLFRVLPPTNVTGTLTGKFMREYFPQKFTKIALIHTQEEYGSTGRDGLVKQLEKYNLKLAAVETHKIGDTDYSSQILKIKALNPEVLFTFSYTKDMALILKQSHELGLDCVKIGYIGTNYSLVPTFAGMQALKKFYGPTPTSDTMNSERLKSFSDMYRKEFPDYMKNPLNPSDTDITTYVGFQVMVEALKRAGRDLTRTKYIQALESIKDFRSPWMPPVSFSPTQHEGVLQERFVKYDTGEAKIIEMEIKME
jgi:branched-chain amino acid transport system substrate-binding protein